MLSKQVVQKYSYGNLYRLPFLFIVIPLLMLLAFQAFRVYLHSGKVSYSNVPFQRNNPYALLKILFIGDSTALGTGAGDNTESVAGWFGQDFPSAHIINVSQNGKRLSALVQDFFPSLGERYNLVVMQIGGNDILRLTPLKNIERDLSIVIERAKMIADHVVILHSGNVGAAPIFCWPFNWLYAERSRMVRALYLDKAKATSVLYADLFAEREVDPFLKDISRFYSADYLHPSGQGYKIWYETICATLYKAKVKLSDKGNV